MGQGAVTEITDHIPHREARLICDGRLVESRSKLLPGFNRAPDDLGNRARGILSIACIFALGAEGQDAIAACLQATLFENLAQVVPG